MSQGLAALQLPTSLAMEGQLQNCPFCGYRPQDEYNISMHMEEHHPENGTSPFVAQDDAVSTGTAEDGESVMCPRCNETVALSELADHNEFHEVEEDGQDDAHEQTTNGAAQAPHTTNGYRSPYGNSTNDVPEIDKKRRHKHTKPSHAEARNRQSGATDRWKHLLGLPSATKKRDMNEGETQRPRKRLGKSELGQYAHEDVMPASLISLLREKGQIMQGGIVSVIASLLQTSRNTEYAYLCNSAVDHISKLKKEGGFCGYRNIQMLSSYIIGARAAGAHHFNGSLPSVFDIQEYIEAAWDKGVNAQGRIETGGVRGTRKYIGTPEAQAMFISLDIPCNAQGFKSDQGSGNAEARLLHHVEQYFEDGGPIRSDRIRRTRLPPIYFQHRGHSLTIVGFEKKQNGSKELLVFDPMFHDSEAVVRLIGQRQPRADSPDSMLKAYRRGNKYLKRFHEFEILKLTSRLPDAETAEQAEMGNYWVPRP